MSPRRYHSDWWYSMMCFSRWREWTYTVSYGVLEGSGEKKGKKDKRKEKEKKGGDWSTGVADTDAGEKKNILQILLSD